MFFVQKFNLGTIVKVLEDGHAFPNGLSHERSGIDVEEDFHFPIKADIRGLRGKIISDWGINTGGIIIETKVEGRKATFLIPREIVAPV